MIAHRAIASILSGIVVHLCLTLLFGPAGLQHHRELIVYENALGANIYELEVRNDELERRIFALQRDRDLLTMYARSMGYYKENERRIVVSSTVDVTEPLSPGRVVQRTIREPDNRASLRLAAAVAGLGVFALLQALGSRGDVDS